KTRFNSVSIYSHLTNSKSLIPEFLYLSTPLLSSLIVDQSPPNNPIGNPLNLFSSPLLVVISGTLRHCRRFLPQPTYYMMHSLPR
ncbi:hypothetical protein Tsubulata_014623, partial [Turnera subulata]